MPLTRETITVASRVMLPAYTILSAAFGLVYTFDPLDRLGRVHALAAQRAVMGGSMLPWGLVFLALTALMVAAIVAKNRLLFAFGLCCCAMTWGMWSVLYAVSAVIDPQTSVLAPAFPAFVVACCVASTMSLLKREI
jgi:hypothetical protein